MLSIPEPRCYKEMSQLAVPWHTTFIGQAMQHNYWMYYTIERVLSKNQNIKSIVELGTGAGALACLFGLWGIKLNIPIHTIDNVVRHDTNMLRALNVKYHDWDIFSIDVLNLIKTCAQIGPLWLFCDGGNKAMELQTYAATLPTGSIISAHDLGREFFHDRDAGRLCDGGILEPYHPEWWMEGNVQLAIYKRK